ncbi:MAG: carboxylate-amine ligase [Candidatus Accumulibacter sp. BA-94]|nr:MAG: carboxylate-amine ligase [Candidatus Accumulibacter sp. BA-94]
MSPARRYAVLNEQIFRLRGGSPLSLNIAGIDHLATTHTDVMLEAATTSFQVHLQVPAGEATRAYNAAQILAAPLVALSANSPFLFGRALWHETRVPLFEQAVDCCDPGCPQHMRVTFGSGYLTTDPTACFAENLASYAVLLPFEIPGPIESYAHLRLHNGTIWRWNRMLIGFDDGGQPHLRIELRVMPAGPLRVMPAGPSIIDMMANAAFYYGSVFMLTRQTLAPEAQISFAQARENFYLAARYGLDAQLLWFGGQRVSAGELLEQQLLPLARTGLEHLDLSTADVARYLEVIAGRLRNRRNGAAWQLAHHARHHDFARLTADYLDHQRQLMPVHEWPI